MDKYQQLLDFLHTLAPPTYKENGREYQWSLENMHRIDSFLGNPSKKIRCIHVAGTNGKGSTVSYLAALLIKAGYKIGYYRSPQMFDIRERFYINDNMIRPDEMVSFFEQIQAYLKAYNASMLDTKGFLCSFSEFFVSLAFYFFAKNNVDFAIIETGIGGLNDPTNIIESPLLSIITSISYDHTGVLGNTLKQIAVQKCGIIKSQCPVLVGHINEQEVITTIHSYAQDLQSPCYFVDDWYNSLGNEERIEYDANADMAGEYQKFNLQTVSCALHILKELIDINLPFKEMQDAIKSTAHYTGLYGRWEIISTFPTIIADVASNIMGMHLNFEQLEHIYQTGQYSRLVLIFGIMGNDYVGIKKFLPRNAYYIIAESRGYLSSREIAEALNINGYIATNVSDAIQHYKTIQQEKDLVYIGGSPLIVKEALIMSGMV